MPCIAKRLSGSNRKGGVKMAEILKDKRILIVDDEPDILETLKELLDVCIIDTAPNFETAQKFLKNDTYDAAILDIMGVDGYDLLELTTKKGIPTIMLTAHALSADNLVKSIKEGARSYLPVFNKKFGADWKDQHKTFWEEYDRAQPVTRDEAEKML
jgi:CheY-like chemotaxis protein